MEEFERFLGGLFWGFYWVSFSLLGLPVALMWKFPADLTLYSAVRLMPRFT